MRLRIACLIGAVLLAFGLFGPCFKDSAAALAKHFRAPQVVLYDRGSMKEIYKDNGAAKIKLSLLKDTAHLYALGPLSDLRGEILVWDSQPFESRARDGAVRVKQDWDESAAYLVWASVPKWKKVMVPTSVRSPELMEQWLRSMSGPEGFPLRSQFPFLIKGHFGAISWHVVNVQNDGKPLTPQKHQEQKFHGVSHDLRADMLGFYSPEHQGFFIPQGHSMHLHVKVGEELVAHVDDFDPYGDNGLNLYIPAE